MKKILLSLLTIGLLNNCAISQTPSPKIYYVGTNLLSPLSAWQKNNAMATALTPLISNLEYGLTLNAGYFKKHHALETRLTYGKSNKYNTIS